MKVAVLYNKREINPTDVINVFGMPTKETYNPKTVEKVATALEKGGHNVRVIEGNMYVAEQLRDFMPKVISGERPGMVFNMAYGIQGQSRYTHIPALLEMLGIPYVGSGPSSHAIALDKVLTKVIFMRHSLPTPRFWVFSSPNESHEDIIYPVIVKPKMEAVSFGLRIVDNRQDLVEAVAYIIQEFQQHALVEQFIAGREFAVGVLGNPATGQEILPIVEIDLQGDPNAIQSETDKKKKPRGKFCPASLPEAKTKEIANLTREAFNALGLYDFARVDYRMDQEGNLFLLEINSMASLGLTGSYVHAAGVAGYDYDALVNRMLDHAALRYFGENYLKDDDEKEDRIDVSDPIHVQIRGYLRSQISTIEDYLQQMVLINSHVYNVESVNSLGKWISKRFSQLGFHRQVYPQTEVGNIIYYSNHSEENNDILLLVHIDNLYDYQSYTPYYHERGRIYGSGVAESKGGVAIILAALQALQFTQTLEKICCGVLLTTDDSLGGKFSKNVIAEKSQQSNCVAGLKYGGLQGEIVTSCCGEYRYRIEMTNIKDGQKEETPDVVVTMCEKVLAWKKLTSSEQGVTVTVTGHSAQTKSGRGADHALASVSLRFNSKKQAKLLDKQIRDITDENKAENIQIQIKRIARRLPVIENDDNRAFFKKVKKLAKKLEVRAQPAHRDRPSDICHAQEGVAVLDGLGPVGGDIQSSNEYIMRDSLIDRATLLAMIILRSNEPS